MKEEWSLLKKLIWLRAIQYAHATGGPQVVLTATGTMSDGYLQIATDFVPVSGKTYTADFTCSSQTTIPQGTDLPLTYKTMSGSPALESSSDWWINFIHEGSAYFWCNYSYGSETIELTIKEV